MARRLTASNPPASRFALQNWGCRLVLAATIALSSIAGNRAQAAGLRTDLAISVGVPFEFLGASVLGSSGSGAGPDSTGPGWSLAWISHVELRAFVEVLQPLSLTAWISHDHWTVRDGALCIDHYAVTMGLGVAARWSVPVGDHAIVTSISAGAGVMAAGIDVDRYLGKHVVGLGGRAALEVGVSVSAGVTVGLEAGIGLWSSPLANGTWFNRPLGRTLMGSAAFDCDWNLPL